MVLVIDEDFPKRVGIHYQYGGIPNRRGFGRYDLPSLVVLDSSWFTPDPTNNKSKKHKSRSFHEMLVGCVFSIEIPIMVFPLRGRF